MDKIVKEIANDFIDNLIYENTQEKIKQNLPVTKLEILHYLKDWFEKIEYYEYVEKIENNYRYQRLEFLDCDGIDCNYCKILKSKIWYKIKDLLAERIDYLLERI